MVSTYHNADTQMVTKAGNREPFVRDWLYS